MQHKNAPGAHIWPMCHHLGSSTSVHRESEGFWHHDQLLGDKSLKRNADIGQSIETLESFMCQHWEDETLISPGSRAVYSYGCLFYKCNVTTRGGARYHDLTPSVQRTAA